MKDDTPDDQGLENTPSEGPHRRAEEFFLDSIVENIPHMIFVKDAEELRFVRFNKAGEELLGYDRADLIGRNDYDFFPEDEADFFTRKDRDVLAGGTVLDIPEEPIHTKAKGKRILHTKKIPILDEQGCPRYLLGISEDITEALATREALTESLAKEALEQAARKAAEEAVRARDEFLSIASHELRTPITAVHFAVQSVLRLAESGAIMEVPSGELLHVLSTADRQTRRLAKLIDTLLDVSRLREGTLQPLDIARVDLALVVQRAIEQLAGDSHASGSRIDIDLSERVLGDWDADRLEQVVTNIVSNAIKYGGGNPIQVTLACDGRTATLTVADDGIGIDAESQAGIFECFERAVPAKHYGGLGLGLYIVRCILDAHGGRIWVDSALGRGAKFTVELPCAQLSP